MSTKSILISLALSACAVVAHAQDIVKIGALEAQTGPLNTYGWMGTQGMRLAVHEINQAGGF